MTYGQTAAVSDIDASVHNLRREILRHVRVADARKAVLAALDQVHQLAAAAVAASSAPAAAK
jgi:hypothetical protein